MSPKPQEKTTVEPWDERSWIAAAAYVIDRAMDGARIREMLYWEIRVPRWLPITYWIFAGFWLFLLITMSPWFLLAALLTGVLIGAVLLALDSSSESDTPKPILGGRPIDARRETTEDVWMVIIMAATILVTVAYQLGLLLSLL